VVFLPKQQSLKGSLLKTGRVPNVWHRRYSGEQLCLITTRLLVFHVMFRRLLKPAAFLLRRYSCLSTNVALQIMTSPGNAVAGLPIKTEGSDSHTPI